MPTITEVVTVNRASSATYTDADGVMKVAPIDVWRRDHDPVTKAPRGVLREEQRTNLVTYSEQFDNAAWQKNTATITPNVMAAPDGSVTMSKFVSGAGVAGYINFAAYSFTAGVAVTCSGFSKASELSSHVFLILAQVFGGTGGNRTVLFDLAAGTATITGTGMTAGISPVGNGIFRWWVTVTPIATVVSQIQYFRNAAVGDGTSGLYVWGAQLEAGAFPTSYIPTVASQITRAADNLSVSVGGWLREDQSTVVAVVRSIALNAQTAWSLTSGAQANSHYFRKSGGFGTPDSQFVTLESGIARNNFGFSSFAADARFATAFAWKAGDSAASINGTIVGTSAGTPMPIGLTKLQIGNNGVSGAGNEPFSGWIERLIYFPRRLSNAELQALTVTS